MKKIKLTKLKKFGARFRKFPKKLAKKSFLTFLGLFFIVSVLGLAILFYYGFLIESFEETANGADLLKLDTKSQQEVLEKWEKMREKFNEADNKEYIDPFSRPRSLE